VNDLVRYFSQNTGRVIDKWEHYFEIYDRHFSRYRGTAVKMLEIGVYQGGSLQMWKEYFGPKAQIWGVDIDPSCKAFEEDQIRILIGDQEDRKFLRSIMRTLPRLDILLDDGGHSMKQQIHTFEELFGHIDANGVYLCEDMHTSYRTAWGGKYKGPGTFVEYTKNFIDSLNAWHSKIPWYSKRQRKPRVNEFTRSTHSLHFYDSVLVIEKRPMQPPTRRVTGPGAPPASPTGPWKT
jgi:hypothetical protein